jgi:hypothetical protein
MVRENLKTVQSRQRRDLRFEVGDYVNLKVSPIRGINSGKTWRNGISTQSTRKSINRA